MAPKKSQPVKRCRPISPSKRKLTEEDFFGGAVRPPADLQEAARRTRISAIRQFECATDDLDDPLPLTANVDFIGESLEFIAYVPPTTTTKEWKQAWSVIQGWLKRLSKYKDGSAARTHWNQFIPAGLNKQDFFGSETPMQLITDREAALLAEFKKDMAHLDAPYSLEITPAWVGKYIEWFIHVPTTTTRGDWMDAWAPIQARIEYLVPKPQPPWWKENFKVRLQRLNTPQEKWRHPWPEDGIPRGAGKVALAQKLNWRLEQFLLEVISDEEWEKSNGEPPNPATSHGFGKAKDLLAAVYPKSSRPSAKSRQIDQIIKDALEKLRRGHPAFPSGGLVTTADAHEYLRRRTRIR